MSKRLAKYKTDTLSNLVRIRKSIEPGNDNYKTEGIPFIRMLDLSKFGLSNPSIFLSNVEFGNTITPKQDSILLSKDGSVDIAYKITKNMHIIISSAILYLGIKNILPNI